MGGCGWYIRTDRGRVLVVIQLCANAMYGFTGATVNSLFSRQLGDSVLSLGRTYLQRACTVVAEKYPDLRVIYGDTDSIFVRYPPGWGLDEAVAHSRDVLTRDLNQSLPERVKVKHERVLQPFLLQHIRRYAGLDQGKDGKAELLVKGMEAVQRNSMPLLVTLMNQTLLLLLQQPTSAEAKAYIRRIVNELLQVNQSHSVRRTTRRRQGHHRLSDSVTGPVRPLLSHLDPGLVAPGRVRGQTSPRPPDRTPRARGPPARVPSGGEGALRTCAAGQGRAVVQEGRASGGRRGSGGG
jgi:hypothetical protein